MGDYIRREFKKDGVFGITSRFYIDLEYEITKVRPISIFPNVIYLGGDVEEFVVFGFKNSLYVVRFTVGQYAWMGRYIRDKLDGKPDPNAYYRDLFLSSFGPLNDREGVMNNFEEAKQSLKLLEVKESEFTKGDELFIDGIAGETMEWYRKIGRS